jgi:protein TonB
MRLALPGSALIHLAVLALAITGLNWQADSDAPAPASVSVAIIEVTAVTENTTEVVQSESLVDALAAGEVEQVEPIEAETIEPEVEPIPEEPNEAIEPEAATEVAAATAQSQAPEPVEQAEVVEMTTRADSDVLAFLSEFVPDMPAERVEIITPTEVIEPEDAAEPDAPPTPLTKVRPRLSEPIVHKPRVAETRPTPQRPQNSGNRGNADANATSATASARPAQAGEGSGGSADLAEYGGQVYRRIERAKRDNRHGRGSVIVSLTIMSNGQLGGSKLTKSSGSAALDKSALDTVNRAAPYPALPAVFGASHTFDIPIDFTN